MRVTSGSLKGRSITVSKGNDVRPTTDKVRAAIFNVLNHGEISLQGSHILDLFCGSGALGLEALSNGAAAVTFIDQDVGHVSKNAEALGVYQQCIFYKKDVLAWNGDIDSYDLIFMDPPYGQDLASQTLEKLILKKIKKDAVFIIETEKQALLPAVVGFEMLKTKTYGDTQVTFLRKQ